MAESPASSIIAVRIGRLSSRPRSREQERRKLFEQARDPPIEQSMRVIDTSHAITIPTRTGFEYRFRPHSDTDPGPIVTLPAGRSVGASGYGHEYGHTCQPCDTSTR